MMIGGNLVRLLWAASRRIRRRRQPDRSPLEAGGAELRAAVASLPNGLASVTGMAPEMRPFDPATDPVLRQWRERLEADAERRRVHDLNSRTGNGRRDPDVAWSRMVDRHDRSVRGE